MSVESSQPNLQVPSTLKGMMSKNKLTSFLMLVATVFVVGFVWHWVNNPLVVAVAGTGEVSVVAEKAIFTITVSAVDNDLTFAVSQVRNQVTTMKRLLEAEGISSANISESQLQVTPAGALVAGATGHQAVITLTVETPNVDTVGELVVFLYQNGASLISQPIVLAENQEKLEGQALGEALKEANQKAAELGRKKLKFFRRPVSITQVSSGQAATSTKSNQAASGDLATNSTFDIVQGVNVVYEMW